MDKRINMNNDTFKDMKEDFSNAINATIDRMRVASADEATVTVKLKIKTVTIPIATSENYRSAIKPKFEHEVSSVVAMKDKKTGILEGNYELTSDGCGDWKLRDLGGQIDMFEETEV